MKKRIISLVLVAVILVLNLLPLTATAAGAYEDGYYLTNYTSLKTAGEDLFASSAALKNDSLTVSLKKDTWYYMDASKNSSVESFTLLGLDGTSVFSVNLATFDKFVFYTGNSTTMTATFFEGAVVPSGVQLFYIDSFDTAYDIARTSFSEDMQNVFPDLMERVKTLSGSGQSSLYVELITMYEGLDPDGYIEEIYLYFFNPSGKPIKSVTSAPYTFENYPDYVLQPVFTPSGFTDKANDWVGSPYFYKLKLHTGSSWAYQCPTDENGVEDTTTRRYLLKDLTVEYADGTTATFDNDAEIIVTNPDVNVAPLALDDATGASVETVEKGVQIIRDSQIMLDIGYTFYRTDTSSEGKYYHNQVDSIYFNVPNWLLEEYGELTNVVLTYNQATTKPIIVTDEAGLYYNFLLPYLDGTHDGNQEDGSFDWGNGLGFYKNNWNLIENPHYWHSSESDIKDQDFFGAFLVTDADAGVRDPKLTVEWETVVQWMIDFSDNYLKNYPNAETVTIADPDDPTGQKTLKVVKILFESVTEDVVIETKDINLNVEGYAPTHSGWDEFWNFGWFYAWSDEAEEDSFVINAENAIVELNSTILKSCDADDLLYWEGDKQDLVDKVQEAGKDATTFLARFNVSRYYEESLSYTWRDQLAWSMYDDWTYMALYKIYDNQMYTAQEDVYLDLHVLRLDFESDTGVVSQVEVDSNHINGGGDITDEKDPDQVEDEYRDDALEDDPLADFLKTLAIILGVVLVVLLIVFVGPIVAPFLLVAGQAVWGFFKSAVKAGKTAVGKVQKVSKAANEKAKKAKVSLEKRFGKKKSQTSNRKQTSKNRSDSSEEPPERRN